MPEDAQDRPAAPSVGDRAAEVTFVLPSFRSWPWIDEALTAIRRQRFPGTFEAIVVDSSDDGTAARVRESHPWARVVQSGRRLSPAEARNLGVRESSGGWLAMVDADVTLPPDWLQVLLRELQDSRARLAGAAMSNANPELRPSRVLHWIEFSEFLPGLPTGPRIALNSSNLLLRRRDFDAAGGFPIDFRMCEDLILSSRVGGCRFVGHTAVGHRHRCKWPTVRRHLEQLGYWSGRYRREHPVRGRFLRRLPFLALGLIPLRLVRIARRIVLARAGAALFCRDLPWMLAGLAAWARGFRRGLKGEASGAEE